VWWSFVKNPLNGIVLYYLNDQFTRGFPLKVDKGCYRLVSPLFTKLFLLSLAFLEFRPNMLVDDSGLLITVEKIPSYETIRCSTSASTMAIPGIYSRP
jgi:hypothetical protein